MIQTKNTEAKEEKRSGVLSKRQIKVLALSLGQTLTTVLTLGTMIIFSRVLSKEDLATYRQTLLAYEFVTPILTLGIPSAMYYFLTGNQRKKKVIIEGILILVISASVFSFFLYFGGNKFLAHRFDNIELLETLKWFTLYPIYTFPALVLIPALIIMERVKTATLYNIITNFLLATLIIITCYQTESYKIPLLIKVIFPIFSTPILFYLVFRTLDDKWEIPLGKDMLQMIRFGAPLGLSATLATLSVHLDKVLVSSFATPEEFAIYSNGAIEIPLIGIITGSISSIIMVDMKKLCMEGRKEEAVELYKASALKTSFILFPAMIFLFLFAKDFMVLLFSEKYSQSFLAFRIYLLLIPIRIMSYGSALTILGKSKETLLRGVIDLGLNFVLSLLFVKLFGYYGPAWATIITIYCWHVPFNLYSISKGFETRIKNLISYKKLLLNLLIATFSGVITSLVFVFKLEILVRFLVAGVLFSIIYTLLSYIFISEFKEIIDFILLKFTKKNNFL